MRIAPGQGIASRVARTGIGELVADCRSDPDFAATAAERTGYVPHTLLVVPLRHEQRSVGTLTVLDRRDGTHYHVADLERATLFADLAVAGLQADPEMLGDAVATRPAP